MHSCAFKLVEASGQPGLHGRHLRSAGLLKPTCRKTFSRVAKKFRPTLTSIPQAGLSSNHIGDASIVQDPISDPRVSGFFGRPLKPKPVRNCYGMTMLVHLKYFVCICSTYAYIQRQTYVYAYIYIHTYIHTYTHTYMHVQIIRIPPHKIVLQPVFMKPTLPFLLQPLHNLTKQLLPRLGLA